MAKKKKSVEEILDAEQANAKAQAEAGAEAASEEKQPLEILEPKKSVKKVPGKMAKFQ